jgi:hypothetical protein
MSYGKSEWAILRQMDHRALRLYLELKWLGDFKTGVVGMRKNQTLSYEDLAQRVSIPVRQGMSASHATVDGTEIRRLLERLESVGLVADRVHDGTRLTMTLPMSPIKATTATKEAETTKRQAAKKAAAVSEPMPEPMDEEFHESWYDPDQTAAKLPTGAEKLPTEAGPESPANPHEDWGLSLLDDAPSVLTLSNTDQYFSVPDSVRATGEAVASPSTGGACDTHAPPPPLAGRQLVEGVEAAEGTMGELEIELMLKDFDSPPVLYMQTQETRQLIRNMEALGVEGWEIEQAVEQVRKDPTLPLTPAAILRELHVGRIKRQQRRARGLGSRVAL